jgi:hypothetical protein
MVMDEALRRVLEPLLTLLDSGSPVRLVARPGSVVLDQAEGSAPAAVGWEASQHAAALAALGGVGFTRDPSGVTAMALGDLLVLRAPPRASRGSQALAEEGLISELAARLLTTAVGIGRNVLVVGPFGVALQLVAALAADGKRPCVIGRPDDAVPPQWPLLASPREADVYGADRAAAWSLDPPELASLMHRRSGVVGWLDAPGLERALTRFEAAFAQSPPLHVLGSLDFVVVVSRVPHPRVAQIAEIVLVDEGYRPRLVFASGLMPIPAALVPVGLPAITTELAAAGFGVLAEELRHAAPRLPAAARAGEQEAPNEREPATPWPRATRSLAQEAPASVGPPEDSRASPSPGWELDRLDEASLSSELADGGANTSAEDASLAATFGLGPPPRPPGVKPGENRSFADALRRARDRAEDPGDDEPS